MRSAATFSERRLSCDAIIQVLRPSVAKIRTIDRAMIVVTLKRADGGSDRDVRGAITSPSKKSIPVQRLAATIPPASRRETP